MLCLSTQLVVKEAPISCVEPIAFFFSLLEKPIVLIGNKFYINVHTILPVIFVECRMRMHAICQLYMNLREKIIIKKKKSDL